MERVHRGEITFTSRHIKIYLSLATIVSVCCCCIFFFTLLMVIYFCCCIVVELLTIVIDSRYAYATDDERVWQMTAEERWIPYRKIGSCDVTSLMTDGTLRSILESSAMVLFYGCRNVCWYPRLSIGRGWIDAQTMLFNHCIIICKHCGEWRFGRKLWTTAKYGSE